ncbi:hypothetical protein [Rhizobium sp.]|uniref:hypothetical protein n=1 Tax=Rhizobium sp. TaxID=391 RepID=UPI0028A13CD2
MSHPDRLIDLITLVITAARDFTPRETIELGFVHGLCLDAANAHHPDLVEFLATARGLSAVAIVLSQSPEIVTSDDPIGAVWTFVRKSK